MKRPARRRANARRTAPPEARRAQLIKATIRSVAKRGLAETTIATVSSEAKLSQGIINLHFQSKDRLLIEALRHLADEYRNAWGRAIEAAGTSAAARLAAMVNLDFDKAVCERNKLAVWFAFWGAAKFRPTYRKICAARDKAYDDMVHTLCEAMRKEGGYRNVDAAVVADGLSALTDGLWLDLLMRPESMSREQARKVAMSFLADAFPKHFRPAAAGKRR